jgi:hydrogenase maturation protease
MENQKKILILGLGNILMKDDGVGVRVAERMTGMTLPDDVEIMDGGVQGLNLLYYIEGRKKVIVIDTVNAGHPPGTIYRFTEKAIVEKKELLRSAHGVDFTDVIKTAEFMGTKPEEVIFIGIEPESIDEGMELSPKIEKRISKIIELVMEELGNEKESETH